MKRPQRILLVITDLDVGGAEKCCVQLATGLDRDRWSPAVCCVAPPGRLSHQLESAGIPTYSLGLTKTWQAPLAVLRLARLMQRTRPHIVHTFLFHANLVGRLAARKAGVRRVVSSIRVAERRFRYHLVLENLLCRWSDRVLCVSQAVARFTRNRSHVPASLIEVIPNGIDLNLYAAPALDRSRLGLPEGSIVALFVGRLDPQKGIDTLLEAAAIASPHCPRLQLVIAGDGPATTALQVQATKLNLSQTVHFVGWCDNVPALLREADLFVMPSRWEGMPNAVLEAMAAGLPVIATRAEGCTELVQDGQSGRLIGIEQPHALAEALIELAADEAKRMQWGEHGRLIARSEFSLDHMLAAYERIYTAIGEGRGARGNAVKDFSLSPRARTRCKVSAG